MALPDFSKELSMVGSEATKLTSSLKLNAHAGVDTRGWEALTTKLKDLTKQLDAVTAAANKAGGAVSGVGTSGTSSTAKSTGAAGTNMVTSLTSTTGSQGVAPTTGGAGGTGSAGTKMVTSIVSAFGKGGGGGGGIPGVGAGGGIPSPGSIGVASAANFAAAAVSKANAVIDARVDRGRDYALSADRMSVLYQQMTGMSQRQVQDKYRDPLTNYRLGAGGINTLLQLQASTGINAAQQAKSVEALRTYSGFSLSAQDAASTLQNLASAPVANRMFMMGGGGLIGPGGKQRDLQSVMESIVKSSGLTNERMVKSAFASGSMTRAKLTAMGVAPDLQDQVLQYAQQNIQYKEKGGKGMYNAGDKAARKLMGIEDNFATQAEETDRVRTQREERFYSRQADNYADLEKQTQKLVKVFGALEDKLSGLIGARTSNRISSTIGSTIGAVAGSFLPIPGGTAIGAIAGNFLGGLLGDAPSKEDGGGGGAQPSKNTGSSRGSNTSPANDSNIIVPTYNGSISLEKLKTQPGFAQLKPQFQQRLLKMMRTNPKVGFGQGIRNEKEQNELFFGRYKRTNRPSSETRLHEKDRKYQGVWWTLINPANLPAAAPGNSMHGLGLAVDIMGDANAIAWAQAHAAEFQLWNAGAVDPPHFQPIEFAKDSATSYTEKGSPWGGGLDSTGAGASTDVSAAEILPEGATDGGPTPVTGDELSRSADGDSPMAGSLGYESISSRVHSGISLMGGSGGGGGGGSTSGSGTSIGDTTTATTTTQSSPAAGALAGEDVARMLHGAGFRGAELIKMVAISNRESRWVPTAHNPNTATGDNSWGLFQLNTLGKLWDFYKGKGVGKPEDLMNPQTNVNMAKELFNWGKKAKNNGFWAWGDYDNSGPGSSDGHLDIKTATDVVTNAKLGDPSDLGPVATRSGAGGGAFTMNAGHTFHINVPVTMTGSANSTNDLQRIAKEVARLIQREVETMKLRTN